MSTTGYAYASGQGFHVKLTRMGTAVPLQLSVPPQLAICCII
ncbi:MAG: hypothetical protein RMY34_22405 [Aulosira sp. DedQUE10]|nr:hypothetical protein [Aulosira sp. DedQUE10]